MVSLRFLTCLVLPHVVLADIRFSDHCAEGTPCIEDFSCPQIKMGTVKSSIDGKGFSLLVDGLGLECSGSFRDTNVHEKMNIEFSNCAASLPISVSNGVFTEVDLSGMLQCKPQISMKDPSRLPQVMHAMGEFVTASLNRNKDLMEEFAKNRFGVSKDILPPDLPDGSTFAVWTPETLQILSDLRESYPYDGIKALTSLLTGQTETIPFAMDEGVTMQWPVGDSCKMRAYFDEISFTGLEDVSQTLSFAPPSKPTTSLDIKVPIDNLSLKCPIQLILLCGDNEPMFEENLVLHTEFTDVLVSLDLYVAMTRDRLDSLYVDQLMVPDCLLKTFDAIHLNDITFDMRIKNYGVKSLGNSMYSSVLADILQIGVPSFPDLVDEVVRGVASGPLRLSVNNYLANKLSSLHCPEHVTVDGPPHYVHLSQGEAKDAILSTMGGLLTAAGIDDSVISAGSAHFGDFFEDVASKIFGWDSFLGNSYSRLVNLEDSKVDTFSRMYENQSVALASYGECLKADGCARLISRWSAESNRIGSSLSGNTPFSQFFIDAGVVAKLNANKVQNLQYRDILNPDCLLSTFDDVSVTQLLTRKSKSAVSAMDTVLAALPSADLLGVLNGGIHGLLSDSAQSCSNERHSVDTAPLKKVSEVTPSFSVHKERTEDCTQADDALECAVNNIVLGPFPELCINISTGDQLCLDQLTCFDIDMTGIPSDYIPPTTFLIGIENMAVTCRADWSMSGVKGVLDATIKDFTSAVSFTTRVLDMYPVSVSVSDCDVESVEVELVFSGGSKIVTALLNSLTGLGEAALEKAITALLCETLDEAIADAITKLLADKIDPFLQELISYGPSEPPVLPGDINWHDSPIETIHTLIDSIDIGGGGGSDIMDCFMSSVTKDKTSTVNKFLDKLAVELGNIRIPINQSIPITQNASIFLDVLVISGFNTIEELKLFETSPTSNVTLISAVELESFSMTLFAAVNIGSYTEKVKIDVELQNVTVGMDLVLGVNEAKWKNLYLDQLVYFSCWQSTVDEVSLSSLLVDLTIDQLKYIQVTGDAGALEQDVVSLVDNFFVYLTEGFGELLTASIAGLFQGPIRTSVNELLANRLSNRPPCPVHVNSSDTPADWIVWAESPFIKTVDKIFDDVLGVDAINAFMTCATNGTGTASIPLLDGAWTLVLTGLNSFYDFSILLPVTESPYSLFNAIGIGYCPDEETNCNKFGIDLVGTSKGSPVDIQILLENTKLTLGLFMEMDMNEIGDLQVSSWRHAGCKMTAVDILSLYEFAATTSSAEIVVNGGEVYGNITKIVDKLLALLSSDATIEKINANLEDTVDNSEYVCTDTINPANVDGGDDGGDKDDSTAIYIVCGVLSFVVIAAVVHYFMYGSRDDSVWRFLYKKNVVETYFPDLWLKYRLEDTLMFNPNIHLGFRAFIPIFILATIGLFMYSNAVYAVDVMVEIDIGEKEETPPPAFSFSLQNTVEDMWNAEVYPLAILIAFFSGAWPYIKLLTMLFSWILPPSIFKLGLRDTSLVALDALGKWSLIDAYVMVMMMVAFHVELNLADGLAVIITVVSKTAFFTFITASIFSLIAGHLVLYYHHYVTEMKTAPAEDMPESIMNRSFPCVSRGTKVKCTSAGKVAFVVVLLITGAAIWFGASIDTFKFEFRGLVGYLMGRDADEPYSLVSVGTTLPDASGKENDPGVMYLQAAYFMFGVGMPLALIFSSIMLWITPLRLKQQQRLLIFAEVCNAWSALDVFVVSIIAALLEIQQFAAFIVGDACDGINEWLEENMDDELHGDDKCFDVVAILLDDMWTIATAAVLMVVVCYPVLMVFDYAINARLHEIGIRQTFAFRTKSIEGMLRMRFIILCIIILYSLLLFVSQMMN